MQQLFKSAFSVIYATWLFGSMDEFTPDFFHYLTCVVEDEGHFLWVILLWSAHKYFFCVDDLKKDLALTIVIGLLESSLALYLTGYFNMFYFISLLCVMMFNYLRSYYSEHLNMICFFFVIYYFSINFAVNTIDLLYNKKFQGYYHDEEFLMSFSYKTHQGILCTGLAFISS